MSFFKPTIQGLSHSRLKVYEDCPRKAKYKFIDRLEEPSSENMDRGLAMHKMLENWLKDKSAPLPDIIDDEMLQPWYEGLRAMPGVQAELQLAFTSKWQPVEWFGRGVWMRVAIDAAAQLPDKSVVVVDHKSGKMYAEHEQQAELYALAGFHHWPDAPTVEVAFAYLDIPSIQTKVYTREKDFDELMTNVANRCTTIGIDTTFVANPGPKCRWCHFRKSNEGPCEHG